MKHSGSTNVLTVAELTTAVNNLSCMCVLSGLESKSEKHTRNVDLVTDKMGINACLQSAVFSETVSQFESGKEPVRSQSCTRPIDSICD